MLCVLILYMSGETYSLKSIMNDSFQDIFSTLGVFTKICWEEVTVTSGLLGQHTTY